MSDVQTWTEPPEPAQDDEGDTSSARLTIHWIAVDDRSHEAAVQLFGEQANDPEQFAEALLRAAIGLGALIGPAHHWAVTQRLAAYDGTTAT